MSRNYKITAALAVLLLAAALVGERADPGWLKPAVLIFGIINLAFSPPGTRWVTGIAIGAAVATLLWPNVLMGPMVLLAGLVWPIAYGVGWSVARESADTGELEESPARRRARVGLAATIAAVAIATLLYRWLILHHLGQTSALFVGLPSLLAVLVVFWVSPRSAAGAACKAVTIGLLVSLLFLGEGIVCIVMSAPLFYAVAIIIGSAVDVARRSRNTAGRAVSCIALFALAPMSLEGVTGITTLDRAQSVTVTRIVKASSSDVGRAAGQPPRFERPLPLYLSVGFPRAISTRIERRPAGDEWIVRIRGGEMRLDGREPPTGTLVLALEESRPGLMRWRVVADDSHVNHYLSWTGACLEWKSIGTAETQVTWTLQYRRGLDPAWYFGPWERYAVTLAAGYLIDSVATP
jgi:hypothetical protein